MTTRQARQALVFGSDDEREGVKQELATIAASDIADVMSWDEQGRVSLRETADIPLHARKAIKKVKVTPTRMGNAIEVEMHDKVSALRMLAKHHGLLEQEQRRRTVLLCWGLTCTGLWLLSMRRKKMGRTKRASDRSSRRKVDADGAFGGLDLDFTTSPTVWKFLNDDAFFRGLLGPVGSGKSYACAAEVMLRAVKQPVSPKDGVRYSRFVVVRNSYPELRTTTIKTWLELFPENVFGPMRWSPPITHHIKLPARGDAAGIDCEVIFLALDQPKDIRKLLSLELTGGWCNEARELPLAVIQGLTHRVGRYPTKAHGRLSVGAASG